MMRCFFISGLSTHMGHLLSDAARRLCSAMALDLSLSSVWALDSFLAADDTNMSSRVKSSLSLSIDCERNTRFWLSPFPHWLTLSPTYGKYCFAQSPKLIYIWWFVKTAWIESCLNLWAIAYEGPGLKTDPPWNFTWGSPYFSSSFQHNFNTTKLKFN